MQLVINLQTKCQTRRHTVLWNITLEKNTSHVLFSGYVAEK